MKDNPLGVILTVFILAILMINTPPAAAQGATTSLSGTVVDTSGGVLPGADVTVRNPATASTFRAVTDGEGFFRIPALSPGSYTVSVALMGFKTAVREKVEIVEGVGTSVRVQMEVGAMEQTVDVVGGAEILQTQSSNVATTLAVKQLSQLPMTTRAVYDYVTFLPGVSTATVNRNAKVIGLPETSLAITLDGINIQDMSSSDDRFQTPLRPMQDQIEQVTVSTAGADAAGAAGGATQIRYVSRSGTNQFTGSAYYYLKHPSLNANYWFNNRDLVDPATGKAPKDPVKLQQPGVRLGGPIVIPKVFDGRDKAFFFVNYERHFFDRGLSHQRNVLHPLSQQGVYRYSVSGEVREVNLFDLAGSRGFTATPDPTVARLLADIAQTATQGGSVAQSTDPNRRTFSYNATGGNKRRIRMGKIDLNLSPNHRLATSVSSQFLNSFPSSSAPSTFPEFPIFGTEDNHRYMWSNTLRSTLSPNLVSETVVGMSNIFFNYNRLIMPEAFSGTVIADQGGYNLGIAAAGVTAAAPTANRETGKTPYWQIANTMNWVKGSHALSFGGNFNILSSWNQSQTAVPTVNFGVVSTDPALTMFSTANFPGASSAQLTAAQNLYAVLTGRVSSISGNAVLNEANGTYEYLGPQVQRGQMEELGLFVQDSWRARQGLTLNYGVRWAIQLPFRPENSLYTTGSEEDVWGVSGVGNLFQPGVLTGRKPVFQQYAEGVKAFETDLNNFSPSVGFAWQPRPTAGTVARILGEGKTVFRGAFSRGYDRLGMSTYADVFGGNPGPTLTAERSQDVGNLGTVPLLFRERERLGPGTFPVSPSFPITAAATSSMRAFDPNFKTPWADSWTFGIQREISSNTAVEVRYVGSRSGDGIIERNYNELNLVENGFLDEFKLAQANLQANIAAGRGNTFAFFGPGSGTSPLRAYLAYLTGSADANDSRGYTASQFTNTTFVNRLALFSPNPAAAAGDLHNNAARRVNALNAGLPVNFFVVNPDLLGGARIVGNGHYTRYHSMELELRRRLTNGVQIQGSYVLSNGIETALDSLRVPLAEVSDGIGRHALKLNWLWELPFGTDRRFGRGTTGLVSRLISGWEFNGAVKVTSGRIMNFGNVRVVGMTLGELQDAYKIQKDDAAKIVYMLPQDIIQNTIRAFNTSATSASGYGALGAPTGRYLAPANGPDCIQVVPGECAARNVYVTGPTFGRVDLNIVKRTAITSRLNAEFRAEFLNALNNINFTPVAQASASQTINQVTAAFRDFNNTQDFGGRMIQLSWRLSW